LTSLPIGSGLCQLCLRRLTASARVERHEAFIGVDFAVPLRASVLGGLNVTGWSVASSRAESCHGDELQSMESMRTTQGLGMTFD
jgi:hypothetical protein